MWTVYVGGGPRRVNHAAVAIGDRILSFGGYCSGDQMQMNNLPIDIHELNTNTYRWKLVQMTNKPIKSEDTMMDQEIWLHTEFRGGEEKLSEEQLSRLAVPYQRYGHTVVAYQGKAYLWGGRNDEFGASAHLHEFDPVARRWRYIDVGGFRPPARDGHTAVVINDKMFLFGGFEEEAQRFSQETYYFDFKTNNWHAMMTRGDPPLWRDFHTAVALDGKMYIFGGRSDQMGQYHSTRDTYCNMLKVLDISTRTWTLLQPDGAVKPNGRRSHSAWTYNGKMYMFGGFNGSMNKHFDELWCYDPKVNRWDKLNPIALAKPPCARRRQCTVVVGQKVFLFGGTTPVDQGTETPSQTLTDLADLYVFDFCPSLATLAARATIDSGLYPTSSQDLTYPVRMELEYMTEPNTLPDPWELNPRAFAFTNG